MLSLIQKIYFIANIDNRYIFLLVSLMSLQTIFDLVGLGIIVAYFSYIWLGTINELIIFLFQLLEYFQIKNTNLGLIILVLIFFLLRFLAFSITNFSILHFASSAGQMLRVKLLRSISQKQFIELKSLQLADIQRNVFELVNGFVGQGISSALKLIADLLLIISVTVVISLIVNAYFFIGILLLTISIIVLDQFMKKYQHKVGKGSAEASKDILDGLRDFYVSLKFAKISNFSEFFVNKLELPSFLYAKNWRNSVFLNMLPRFILEILVVIFCVFFIFISSNSSKTTLESNFLVLILFLRLLPIGYSVAVNISQLRNCGFLVEKIISIIKTPRLNVKRTSNVTVEKIIINKLSLKLGGRILFKDLSITANRGQVVGIVGETGAGKSSLIEVICNLRKPDDGSVMFLDNKENVLDHPVISYVDQSPFTFTGTLAENIETIQNVELSNKSKKYIYKFNLKHLLEQEKSNFSGENLSGGEIQRLNIIRAISVNSNVLIMDEPTSALDTLTTGLVLEVLDQLVEKGFIIFIITHDQELERFFHQKISLNKGNVNVKYTRCNAN